MTKLLVGTADACYSAHRVCSYFGRSIVDLVTTLWDLARAQKTGRVRLGML